MTKKGKPIADQLELGPCIEGQEGPQIMESESDEVRLLVGLFVCLFGVERHISAKRQL